jgi:HD superfamily phosphohydrolase
MCIAGRVFENIFRAATTSATSDERSAIEYLGTVFRLGALLHDVGHCAFSHSIEQVMIEGLPLLGTTTALFEEWKKADLLEEYVKVYPDRAESPVSHEQIGLILVDEIFRQARVTEACERVLAVSALEVAKDVRAIMDGGLSPSGPFGLRAERAFEAVARVAPSAAPFTNAERENFASDVLTVLHNLVSGTLDVDRLDYLIRDSFHCGVPYGRCDVQMLLGSLSIGPMKGNTVLLLSEKAAHTLEDMLWSRYQLFIQVLNHKTNVGLNAALSRAVEEAVADSLIRRPEKLVDYVAFTDDSVMSTVIRACLHGKLATRSYAKALVDRRVPLHIDIAEGTSDKEELRDKHAKKMKCSVDQIYVGEAKSEFIKEGPLPMLVGWDRRTGARRLRPFREASSMKDEVMPVIHHKQHVFVDRDVAEGIGGKNG